MMTSESFNGKKQWPPPAGEKKKETHRHMMDPAVGDRFTEMFSFYVHVVEVTDTHVTVEEYSPPCEIPKDAKVRKFTREQFIKTYSYSFGVPGYWIRYLDRKAPVGHRKSQLELF